MFDRAEVGIRSKDNDYGAGITVLNLGNEIDSVAIG